MRHLAADLMGTAGDEMALHERKTAPVRETFVLCDGRLRSLHRFVRDEDLILFRILEDLVGERPVSRLDLSKDDGKIGLADLAVTDETAEEVTDLFCLCKKEEPYFALYQILGFYPGHIALYEEAFRHSSASIWMPDRHSINNERLEFLSTLSRCARGLLDHQPLKGGATRYVGQDRLRNRVRQADHFLSEG